MGCGCDDGLHDVFAGVVITGKMPFEWELFIGLYISHSLACLKYTSNLTEYTSNLTDEYVWSKYKWWLSMV